MSTYRITYQERIIKTIDLDAESHAQAEATFDEGIDLDGHEEIDLICHRLRSDLVLAPLDDGSSCRCGHDLAAHQTGGADRRCLVFTSDPTRQFDDGKDRSGRCSPCECLHFQAEAGR